MSQKVLSITFQPPLDNGESRYFVEGAPGAGGSGVKVTSIDAGSHGPIAGYFIVTKVGAPEFIPAHQVSRVRLMPMPAEAQSQPKPKPGKHSKAYA